MLINYKKSSKIWLIQNKCLPLHHVKQIKINLYESNI